MQSSESLSVVVKFSAYAAWMDIRGSFARTYLGTLWQSMVLAGLALVLGIFFSAVFKQQTGVTPGAYRSEHAVDQQWPTA